MNRQEPPAPLTKVKTEGDETYDRAGGNESTGQGLVKVYEELKPIFDEAYHCLVPLYEKLAKL